jgi:hypothetical protein
MTMRFALAVTAALVLVLPGVASADWYISKRRAEQLARYEAGVKYGRATDDGSTVHYAAYCRPQGERAAAGGYIYHRWVCTWVDDVKCEGQLLILGSRVSHSDFNYRVLRGQRCRTGR